MTDFDEKIESLSELDKIFRDFYSKIGVQFKELVVKTHDEFADLIKPMEESDPDFDAARYFKGYMSIYGNILCSALVSAFHGPSDVDLRFIFIRDFMNKVLMSWYAMNADLDPESVKEIDANEFVSDFLINYSKKQAGEAKNGSIH